MEDVSDKFKKVERNFSIIVFISLVLFFGGVILNYFGITFINHMVSAFLGFLVFNIGGYIYYRCPNCDEIPYAIGGEGVAIKPKSCSKCGAKFR
jgi:hypothetical protein